MPFVVAGRRVETRFIMRAAAPLPLTGLGMTVVPALPELLYASSRQSAAQPGPGET